MSGKLPHARLLLLRQRHIQSSLRWLTLATAFSIALQMLALVFFNTWEIIPSALLTTACFLITLLTRWLAARGAYQTAALITIAALAIGVFCAILFTDIDLPLIVLALIFVVAFALNLLEGVALGSAIRLCAVVGVGISIIAVLQTATGQRGTPTAPVITKNSLVVMTAILVIWQLAVFQRRLTRALHDAEHANHVLQDAQATLAAQHDWLSITLHSIGDAVIVTDAHEHIVLVNAAGRHLVGDAPEHMGNVSLGNLLRFVDTRADVALANPVEAVLHQRAMQVFTTDDDIAIIGPDGRSHSITASISPIVNPEGTLLGAVLVIADITDYKQAQAALRISEERFRRIFESRVVGIAIATLEDPRFLEVNEYMAAMLGYHKSELIGRRVVDTGLLITMRQSRWLLQRLRTAGALSNLELPFRRSDGEIREAYGSLEVMSVGNEQYVIAIGQDVTESRLTERALRESENMYRLITEHTHDLIALLDEQNRYMFASPSHQRVLGYHIAQLIGTHVFDLIHPDDREAFARRWPEIVQTEDELASARLLCSDGSHRWFEFQATAVAQGEAPTVVLVARDTTQRREIEAQFHQAQKMESIGRLAGGVAHDFNNILSAITGYTDLLFDELPNEGTTRHDLLEIQRAASRATGLSRQLLTLARRQVIELQTLDLNAIIYEIDKLLRRLLGEDIELVTLPTHDPVLVRGDAGQLEQVLINLAVNARDAMPNGGRLLIETATVTLDDEYSRTHVGVAPGLYALLAVTDTGVGMDSHVVGQAFEPFFTTKPAGAGTGLGLATCYGIVKQHNGEIHCYSEVGVGTTMKMYFPRAESSRAVEAEANPVSKPPRGSETILLAEDEASVRELAARVLRAQGYTVLEASNGEEALHMVESHPDCTIDLLLTDLVMPRMGGGVLAEKLADKLPRIRVLYMSGYPGNAAVNYHNPVAGAAFLQKPFSVAMLAQKVRDLLDA